MTKSHRGVIVVVLALLSVVFALEGSLPGHTHENGRLGLYNAECPLSQLATIHTDVWAPQSSALVSPMHLEVPAAVMSSGWAPSPSASLTDSRAPPLA